MPSGFSGFLILVILAFVGLAVLPGVLSSAGPVLFLVLAVLAFVFVPALRRFAVGLLVVGVLGYMAWSTAYSKYLETAGAIGNAARSPGTFARNALNSWWGGNNWQPFIQGPDGECCVHWSDVGQGEEGDCFLLSALAAVVEVSPGTIKNAISANPDGNYSVRLYDERTLAPQLATVNATFPGRLWSERLVFGLRPPSLTLLPRFSHAQPGDNDTELWPMLFEKAYVAPAGYVAYGQGGNPGLAMQRITGKKVTSHVLASHTSGMSPQARIDTISTVAELDRVLRSAIAGKNAMTAGTLPLCDPAKPMAALTPQGLPTEQFRCLPTLQSHPLFAPAAGKPIGYLVQKHAYYLKSYAATGITLGNPWKGAGDVSLTPTEFLSGFREFHNIKTAEFMDCGCQ